jgi:hypothetical protein
LKNARDTITINFPLRTPKDGRLIGSNEAEVYLMIMVGSGEWVDLDIKERAPY